MYKDILIALDNSGDSKAAADLALFIGKNARAKVTGCHVYAARLHDERFRQMEGGLPERYQNEEELEKQRTNHESLIERGLRIISESYTDLLSEKAEAVGIEARASNREGKNFSELLNEIKGGSYDLLAMGAHGLGRVETSRIGSVTERVVRGSEIDMLITRDSPKVAGDAPVFAAVDGSPDSFGAVRAAAGIASLSNRPLVILAVFDPDYHITAFRALAGVLSDEKKALFNFEEQEKLHEEIIDEGLKKLYEEYLEEALTLTGPELKVETVLLAGKPFNEIVKYVRNKEIYMLVAGRRGAHSDNNISIGATAENLIREAPCHVLLTTGVAKPVKKEKKTEDKMATWTEEAEETLKKIPIFARGMAKKGIEKQAEADGVEEITAEYMNQVRNKMGG